MNGQTTNENEHGQIQDLAAALSRIAELESELDDARERIENLVDELDDLKNRLYFDGMSRYIDELR